MDASINKILAAVQEEQPKLRRPPPRKASSGGDSLASTSPNMPSFPIHMATADERNLPTMDELSGTSLSPPSEELKSPQLPSGFVTDDSISQPTANLATEGRPATSSGHSANTPTTSSKIADNHMTPSNTSSTKPTSQYDMKGKGRNTAAPSYIALPSRSKSSETTDAGFSPTQHHKSDNFMLTPGGDDLAFNFKKKKPHFERRDSRETTAVAY